MRLWVLESTDFGKGRKTRLPCSLQSPLALVTRYPSGRLLRTGVSDADLRRGSTPKYGQYYGCVRINAEGMNAELYFLINLINQKAGFPAVKKPRWNLEFDLLVSLTRGRKALQGIQQALPWYSHAPRESPLVTEVSSLGSSPGG